MTHALLVELKGFQAIENALAPEPEPQDIRDTWGVSPEAQEGKAALDAMTRGR